METLVIWAATGFGLGLSPALSGTAGALLGLPVAWFTSRLRLPLQIAAAAALAAAAIPLCDKADVLLGGGDDSRIVADEYLIFPLAVLGLPLRRRPVLLAAAFVASRVFDGLKLPPANFAERLPGGLGIVADDVVASLYALIVAALLHLAFTRRARSK